MATYYVDSVNGSDTNNGLGPDASAVTNKPWLTIGKALGASGIASGDTVYLSPAGPFREVVTVAMTSATVETKILGDPANIQGFKTSGGASVAPGPIIWTAYTTDDKTAPSASSLLTLSARDFLTFQYIMFVQGTGSNIVLATSQTSQNIVFKDCAFLNTSSTAGGFINATCAFNTPFNWTIDRCLFCSSYNGSQLFFTLSTSGSGSDYDANVLITNSLFLCSGGGPTVITITANGTAAVRGGGIRARNCFVWGAKAMNANQYISTTTPCQFDNGVCIGGASGMISAFTLGQVTEDYNLFCSSVARSNVTAGTHSISDYSYATMFHFGQEQIWGMRPRTLGEPMASSPLLGFGNDGSQTAYDGLNRPKPAGGASASQAVGWLERGNTWGRETSTVRTGSNAISITGPGYQDFDLPVDNTATSVSVYARYDSTYAGGTKPQLKVLNGEEIGVTAATASFGDGTSDADPGANAWGKLKLANFTPNASGIVTIRIQSSDTNGGGKAFADDFAVA